MIRAAAPPSVSDAGFSLIESLVALLILAVATAGLVGATQAHIDRIGALQDRAAAQWVAENRLVELSLPGADTASGQSAVQMLGRTWSVRVDRRGTADPDLSEATVSVSSRPEAQPLATLTGFIDIGADRP